MNKDESDQDEDIHIKNNILDYKGYFIENEEEDNEPKYYEFGAHFSYKELCKCLEILRKKQIQKEMEKEKEKEIELIKINKKYNKKIENKERNNTKNKENKDNKENNKLQNIINGFNSKIRSRNIGIDNQNENENPNELTFFPFSYNINNLSVKKDTKIPHRSISINKTNFIKIYSKNKTIKYLNANNDILSKNINFKNNNENISNNNIKHFQKKKINFNSQLNKYSDNNIISRNRDQNNIFQQINIPNNHTVNQNNNNKGNDINYFQSYQMQLRNQNSQNSIYQKMSFLNDSSSFNNNSKENININNNVFQKKVSQLIEPKFIYTSLNKNINAKNNKNLKLNKIINNSMSYVNKNGRGDSFNLNYLLNRFNNSNNVKFSSEKKIPLTIGNYHKPSYKFSNFVKNKDYQQISIKLNELSDNIEYKRITPISMKKKKKNLSIIFQKILLILII